MARMLGEDERKVSHPALFPPPMRALELRPLLLGIRYVNPTGRRPYLCRRLTRSA